MYWQITVLLFCITVKICKSTDAIGDKLVSCAACQYVQAQIQSWQCNVNCEISGGQNEDAETSETMNEIKEMLQQHNETLQKLVAPKDSVYVKGSDAFTFITITSGVKLLFQHEVLDVLDSFDTATGIFTAKNSGIYSMVLSLRSGGDGPADLELCIKKTGQEEVCPAAAKALTDFRSDTTTLLYPLEPGDQVYAKGKLAGETNAIFTVFQAVFLY